MALRRLILTSCHHSLSSSSTVGSAAVIYNTNRGPLPLFGRCFWTTPMREEKTEIKITMRKGKRGSFPKIYTKTGDGGTSSLYTGERRRKDDAVFEALGTIDELSSHLGLSLAYAEDSRHPYTDILHRVQCLLQDIGTVLATPVPDPPQGKEVSEKEKKRYAKLKKSASFSPEHTTDLEEWIDEFSAQLPPLENFILPGGGRTSASLHVARSVCRRAERRLNPLVHQDHHRKLDPETLKYLNRLSDLLFTLARFAARFDKKEETIYTQPKDLSELEYEIKKDGIWKKKPEKDDDK